MYGTGLEDRTVLMFSLFGELSHSYVREHKYSHRHTQTVMGPPGTLASSIPSFPMRSCFLDLGVCNINPNARGLLYSLHLCLTSNLLIIFPKLTMKSESPPI